MITYDAAALSTLDPQTVAVAALTEAIAHLEVGDLDGAKAIIDLVRVSMAVYSGQGQQRH